jgi:hypothetical protein
LNQHCRTLWNTDPLRWLIVLDTAAVPVAAEMSELANASAARPPCFSTVGCSGVLGSSTLSFPGRKSQGDEAISGLIECEYNVAPLAHGELAN